MKIKARWVLPLCDRPIDNGIVEWREGEIVDVRQANADDSDANDLNSAIVLPGFVNAHTHLELSHLSSIRESWASADNDASLRDLPQWLTHILAHQQDLSDHELQTITVRAVEMGVAQTLGSGVTTVGDISRFCHLTRPLLARTALRTVSYGEVLGIGKRRHVIEDRLRIAADPVSQVPHLRVGLSPHAPYSIEGNGLQRVVHHARQHDMPVCMHLAETVEEIQFLQTGQGRFKEMLETIGVWDNQIPVPKTSPIRWVCELGALGPECLVAHGNYVDEEEIDLLCATGSSVAYCPRTHHYFGHDTHPFMKMLGSGVNVCIGTDSLASAPSLSILDELAWLHQQQPELSTEMLLMLGTLNGARALGLAQHIGTLEVGKRVDMVAFAWDGQGPAKPSQNLLEGPKKLERVFIDGQEVI